jgi:cytochrome c
LRARAAALAALLAAPLAAQDLTGHGGPVGALAAQGDRVLSGSFDTRAILWDGAAAARVLRFHDGAVTAVALLGDGRLATGGQDGRVAVWGAGGAPVLVTAEHRAPVGVLAVSGDVLYAGGWDGLLQRIDLATGAAATEPAHRGRLAGLAVLDDGRVATVGADLRLAVRGADGALTASADLPAQPNGMALADGLLAVVFADGALRLFSPEGDLRPERFLSERPLVTVAGGAGAVAAAAVDGSVWVLALPDLVPRHRIEPGQGPVWSLAIAGDTLLTGGADGVIRRWSLATGAPLGTGAVPLAEAFDDGSRGAQVWRACAVCHSLTPDGGNRAGPSLHGIYGRRIGSLPGYDYSEALRSMSLIWTPATVAALFEIGPEAYTPGTRMPEQRLPDAEDRRALTEFLARVTQ